jgi:Protein of unknown function (DUF4232)
VTTLAYRNAHAAARRAAVPLAGLIATGLLAAGCGTAGDSGGVASPAGGAGSDSSAPADISESATASAAASGSASRPASTKPAECPVVDLKVTIGAGNGAAGSIYYPLDFTNTSNAACTMYGYPGVAFVTKEGGAAAGAAVLGAPAFRDAALAPTLVTVAPGATAHASLQVQDAQNYPVAICKPVTGRWLQVYPPGSKAAEYVRFTAETCTGKIPSGSTLGIYVVRPGATGP